MVRAIYVFIGTFGYMVIICGWVNLKSLYFSSLKGIRLCRSLRLHLLGSRQECHHPVQDTRLDHHHHRQSGSERAQYAERRRGAFDRSRGDGHSLRTGDGIRFGNGSFRRGLFVSVRFIHNEEKILPVVCALTLALFLLLYPFTKHWFHRRNGADEHVNDAH